MQMATGTSHLPPGYQAAVCMRMYLLQKQESPLCERLHLLAQLSALWHAGPLREAAASKGAARKSDSSLRPLTRLVGGGPEGRRRHQASW